jgi:hypothetical protein
MKDFLGNSFAVLMFLSYVLSIPLAFIFGTKLDVVLAFFIPLYGVVVMIASVASG